MYFKICNTKCMLLCCILYLTINISNCQKDTKILKKSEGLSSISPSKLYIKPRNVATAKVFEEENQNGRSFPLTHDPDYWFDMSKLKEDQKLEEIDNMCVQGVWLVYENTDFQANSKKEVGVISGEKVCVSLKTYGKVSSLQPITLLTSRKSPTLAFFPERDFSGSVFPVDESLGQGSDIPVSSSLITLGNQEWTVVPNDGNPVCISPQGSDKFPVCFVSKLIDGEKIKTGSFLQVYKGCREKTPARTVSIHFCIPYDSGDIQRIDEIAQRMQGRAVVPQVIKSEPIEKLTKKDEMCPPTDKGDKIDDEGKYLLEIRLTQNLQSNENLLWPTDPANIWKLELLDRTFNVIFATCDEPLVPRKYLELIREIFVYLWDREDQVKTIERAVDETEWRHLNIEMLKCNNIVRTNFGAEYANLAVKAFNNLNKPSEIEEMLDPMLHFREKYDNVIETVWLIANHVAATCHHALEFVSNFWNNYIEIFQVVYLNLLESQWMEPKKLNNVYKYVLGGYGIKKMYYKLGICTTVSVEQVDNLDPFSRLMDLKNKRMK